MYHSQFIHFFAPSFLLKLMMLGAFTLPVISKASAPGQVILKGDEECVICASSARELGNNQARFTNCCRQFICAKDAQEIVDRARQPDRRGRPQQSKCP